MVKPDEVRWKPGPAAIPPGAQISVIEGDPKAAGKLFTFRLRFPAGYHIPPHFHPADEHVTVLSGELMMGMGEKLDESKAQALPPGSFAVMPATVRHFAFTRQPTMVQIHAVGPWASPTSTRRMIRATPPRVGRGSGSSPEPPLS